MFLCCGPQSSLHWWMKPNEMVRWKTEVMDLFPCESLKKKKSHLKKSCRPAIANLSGAEIHFCRWTIKMKYTNTTLRDCHFLRSCDKNDWRETTAVFCSYLLCGRACEEGRDAARAVKGRGEGDKWPCRRAEFNGPAVTFTHISNRKLHGCSGKKARQE